MVIDHPARARVAEIMVARVGGAGEEHTRGTGYLVSPGWVLTAYHVVKDSASVGVWLGVPAELAPEAGVGVDPGRVLVVRAGDLALLPVGGQADDPLWEPALFGRLDREPGPAVPVAAAGCPRSKLRPAPARPGVLLREMDYAIGSIAALSDAKTGRFAFAVDVPPGPDPEPDTHSPWEGMSGAAVWASGGLIGVVGQHHPREGLATLTVCPVEQLFGSASEDQLQAWRAALPQLPATAGALWLATPPTVRKIEVARARRAAEALAPRVLIGRSAELAALEAFTSSGTRWRWIQGDAFAGKTALMAWFALHPPEPVDVAACFLRRASGEDTAEYALDVLTRQLALLADRRGYLPPPFVSERSNDFADLLEEAARGCAERGRRLVVLVDGLDEYDRTTASLDLADWLPGDRTLPDQVMLLAASRAGADIRLPPGHPLSGSVQRVTASEAATEVQQAAHAELDRAVRTPGGSLFPLLCCLTVAGSGLTVSEMCALLKRRGRDADVGEIETQLSSSLGRSLMRLSHPEGTGTQVYGFAHDTLLAEARSRFASDLPAYEDLLDAWASEYANSDWPIETPQYLLAPYTRELARRARDPATPDTRGRKAMSEALDRLSALARSPSRHALLFRATGSEYAALSEIRTAQSLIADQGVLDLQALVKLAAYRHAISIHSQRIPPDLVTVWARLGRFGHAEALARTLTSPDDQARALTELATAIAEAGDPGRAEALARTITDPDDQAWALTELATAIAQAGDPDRAYRLAADEALARITGPEAQARAPAGTRLSDTQSRMLTELATAIAQAGDPARAEALARSITDSYARSQVLAELATVAAQAGKPDRAEALARTLTSPGAQARALTELATALAQAADPGHACRLFDDAEALARTIRDPSDQAGVLAKLATVTAQAGDPGRGQRLATDAEALARTITSPGAQSRALTELATALAQAGDPGHASRLFDDAEALARLSLHDQARALTELATAIAQAGDPGRAESLTRTITDPDDQARALIELATAAAQAGDPGRGYRLATDAESLARTITSPDDQARALTELAIAAAQAGDPDRAEALARAITSPSIQAEALAELATAIAQAGDPGRAEALARTLPHYVQSQMLTEMATAIAQAGAPGRAYRLAIRPRWRRPRRRGLAGTFSDPSYHARALAELATAIAQAGAPGRASRLFDDAEAVAHTIRDPSGRAGVLAELATATAQAGAPRRSQRLAADAEALARTLPNPSAQALALTRLVIAIARARDPGHAHRLATDAEALARTITSPSIQAAVLAKLATAIAQAGDPDRAEALTRTITSPSIQARTLTELATAAAQAGDPDRAEALTRTITSPSIQARTLTELATAAAQAGDPSRAYRLAADAEVLARTITSPDDQARELTRLAAAITQAGDPDRAGRLLARALVMGPPGIWWVEPVSRLFPSAISGAWDVLAAAYTAQA